MINSSYPLLLFRRGKVRDVYDKGDALLIVSTDRISAFDVITPTPIPSKGVSLNHLSVHWFERTRSVFPNHLLEKADERSITVRKAERVDIEWVVRSHLYGSAWRAYEKGRREVSGIRLPEGLRLAEELPEVILTPSTKSDIGHDVEISKREALDKGLLNKDDWDSLEEATYRLYDFYRTEASQRGLIIPDFKLEYGRIEDGLIQIDEPPTHDSARFWSKKHYRIGEKQETHCLDKEFLRNYLMRIGYAGEGPAPGLPAVLVEEISKRCVGAYKVLSDQAKIEDMRLRSIEEVFEELQGKR